MKSVSASATLNTRRVRERKIQEMDTKNIRAENARLLNRYRQESEIMGARARAV